MMVNGSKFHLLSVVGLFLSFCVELTFSLKVTSTSPGVLEKAAGDGVIMDCKFTIESTESGPWDIEWSLQPPDNNGPSNLIITYSGDRVFGDYYGPLKDRVHFVATDPTAGDASLSITKLKYNDTGTYQCKVKKAPGLDSLNVKLVVLVKPSKPRCSITGTTETGNDIALHCMSTEGTTPLTYTWEKTTGTKTLPSRSVLDSTSGTLSMKNVSTDFSGIYRCRVSNKVGSDECIVNFSATEPTNNAGVIAGAVIGVLLFLLLLLILIFCCLRRRKEKKFEREIQHEIKEDVPAPKSRASTARSFLSSNRSSLGSMSPSNMDTYPKTQYSKIGNGDYGVQPTSMNSEPSKTV
ncbi:coxsackievirus and adenovirus receptor [Protopterus annectens]|uniref:coxsackievirus and adenovirus receptor n=1 Tax=Protopterus annectens TaxID=7888 RepID=UPI001CFAFD91|nr:coxsackievirus and adenovirus receptor [Protopterus annectens]